ncbi:MAG: hypothetical protein CMD92_08030 [Gammaproteobacteria bacterium]|nr:hypothetical protein [Gammaproteobacteria bacterium]|tara:strand:- start:3078 stop:3413 length:336 start_codon:yes stop_codon:yes gene_type:complete
MLPRPRSVVEEVVADARAPVPTGTDFSDMVFIGRKAAPTTKEEAMDRFMDVVIETQEHQMYATFRVAKAIGQMDESDELLPFYLAKQDLDTAIEDTEKLKKLSELYRRFRD